MGKRIAIFGGSFNPPGLHHREIAEAVLRYVRPGEDRPFIDELIIRPCGYRPDKEATNDVEPIHRAAMADLAFRGLMRCTVDLSDLERDEFMRTYDVDAVYRAKNDAEIWHVVGTDLLRGENAGTSEMRSWYRGHELWEQANFLVVVRGPFVGEDLPPHRVLLDCSRAPRSSRTIREMAFREEDISGWVSPSVEQYIRRHRLYRGVIARNPIPCRLDLTRPLIVLDRDGDYVNAKAVNMAASLGLPAGEPEDPTCIIVLGGDGMMMRAIREHWRKRVPFFGINAGHRGFHLNDLGEHPTRAQLEGRMVSYALPMLSVEHQDTAGEWHATFAYQDAYLQGNFQTIWIEMKENDAVRYARLICDAALVALPVGSTAYARAMGAEAKPINAQILTFAVSCFNDYSDPPRYGARGLPLDTTFSFRNLQPERRTPKAIADGVILGDANEMRIRVSRVAAVEVAYLEGHDLAAKLQ